jgi:hypothetical protein
MSSRFERNRSEIGDPAPALSLVRNHEPPEGERPWQTLVWRLRRLLKEQEVASGEEVETPTKPELRLLPGGRLNVTEERRRPSAVARGRWH